MAKKLLLALLSIALTIELALTVGAFFFPEQTLIQFRIAVNPDAYFMIHLTGWFLLVIDALIVAAIRGVMKNDPLGWKIANLVSLWWVALGVSIFVFCGRADNLGLDSAKGVLILICSYFSAPQKSRP